MKRLAMLLAAVSAVGCGGGVTRQELDLTEQKLSTKLDNSFAQLRSELTGTDKKIVEMLAIEQRVKNTLADLVKLHQQLTELSKELDVRSDKAAASALKVLEFEDKLLADRLTELKRMIAELKPK